MYHSIKKVLLAVLYTLKQMVNSHKPLVGNNSNISDVAIIGEYVTVGNDCVIMDADIGNFVIIGNDVVICNGATVGNYVTICDGAVVCSGVKLHDGVIIDSGRLVMSDVSNASDANDCPKLSAIFNQDAPEHNNA